MFFLKSITLLKTNKRKRKKQTNKLLKINKETKKQTKRNKNKQTQISGVLQYVIEYICNTLNTDYLRMLRQCSKNIFFQESHCFAAQTVILILSPLYPDVIFSLPL